jgi:hypothetical protein
MDKVLFMVEMGNIHFFTYSYNREDAKRSAYDWMGGDPERYIVTPLTEKGDRIKLDIVLYV